MILCTCALGFAALSACAQSSSKKVYIPQDLRQYQFEADTGRWCWKHSSQTPNLIFLWEKGFGDDLSKAPTLEGKPMTVNLDNLEKRVEQFYTYFRDTLKFTLPGSKADRYKMMVMINYSLEGTAYGGTYDDFIGALWVSPNRIQDAKLNCLAHELGHSFQAQIQADSVGQAWGGCGFFEMTSQWMLWQVNPDWVTDENYHLEAFKKLTHKAFLHGENIYHSPYVIEYWAEKRGLPSIARLYREGKVGEDPVMTYKRMYGLSQQAFNDEMFQCYQHLVNFDFKHAVKETRPYACSFDTPLQSLQDGWQSPKGSIPEDYGFNVIPLPVDKKIKVEFKGQSDCDYRYGLVGITTSGQSVYGAMHQEAHAVIGLKQKSREPFKHLFLVVMGAPREHVMLQKQQPTRQYNYSFRVK